MEYHNLIIKFFAEEITDNEMILLKSWISADPENRRIFNEENELWQEASYQTKHGYSNADKAWNNISLRLGLGINNSESVTILSKNNFRRLIAAALVACIIAIGGISLWITGKPSFKQVDAALIRVVTDKGEKATIFLSDSTEIILNSGSTLQYNGNYNLKDRITKLTGEAFFDVSTNPVKPFVVQLDQMNISAKGSRFNVFSFPDEDRIETTLEEGVIQVIIKGKEPINVNPSQQVVYFVRSQKVLVREVATETYTSWRENKLRFNDTPFEEVLRQLGRRYNVKFEVTNPDLLSLKYTATFIDETIEDVMQMLKTVSPITYKIHNSTQINDKHYQKPRIVVG